MLASHTHCVDKPCLGGRHRPASSVPSQPWSCAPPETITAAGLAPLVFGRSGRDNDDDSEQSATADKEPVVTKRRLTERLALLAALPMLLLGACGDDDGGADVEAYCDLARELDEQEDFASDEQIGALIDTAPADIADDVEFVAERFKQAGADEIEQVFGDPEVAERIEPIEQFEAEHCGIGGGDEEGGAHSHEIDSDAQRVDVTATEYDFEFEAPDAGAVSFVMTNDGTEPHIMGISKLREGVSPEEATQAEATPEVTEFAIASDVAAPGEEVVLTFENLEAGGYRMVCFITAPHGEPHAVMGMSVPFTVE
jgi:uncharacterized cupredoxin-like copper-binding protein